MNYDITFCVADKCKGKRKCGRHVDNNVIPSGQHISLSDFSEKKEILACENLFSIGKRTKEDK